MTSFDLRISRRDALGLAMALSSAGLAPRASAQELTTRLTDARALPGPAGSTFEEGAWTDAQRGGRTIPWRIYRPKALAALAPVIIYSHGGGGTRETGQQFGEHLASHGFISLHIQHAGSDRDAFRNDRQQISAAARDPQVGRVRFEDVLFAFRQIQGGAPALTTLADPARVGIAGHSLGAITAQIAAGMAVTGFDQSLAVPQLKGAFALSPSPPRDGYGEASAAFRRMLMPIFHLTGTKDDAPNGDFAAPARRVPFEAISGVKQYLLILENANHFTFGGDPDPRLMGRSFGYPALPRHHDLIKAAAVAFWRAILLGSPEDATFLDGGGYKALLGPGDSFEVKPPA